MDLQKTSSKPPRKRVANFTAFEKGLLAQIIKKTPIVESKLTDGKSVAKKNEAWDLITKEFNCNDNVQKRETITLKRAWDNMKAFRRKARAEQRANLLRPGDGPHAPSPPPLEGMISMVEEAASVVFCEIKNEFDSDGDNKQTSVSTDPIGSLDSDQKSDSEENITFEVQNNHETNRSEIVDAQKSKDCTNKYSAVIKPTEKVHRSTDYIRREAVIRINHLKNKKEMEILILKTQLEVEHIKKKSALLEEERNQILLEKAKIELEEVKKSIILK